MTTEKVSSLIGAAIIAGVLIIISSSLQTKLEKYFTLKEKELLIKAVNDCRETSAYIEEESDVITGKTVTSKGVIKDSYKSCLQDKGYGARMSFEEDD